MSVRSYFYFFSDLFSGNRKLLAAAAAAVPPPPVVKPYPGWRFCIEESTPTPDVARRLALWTAFKQRRIMTPVRLPWYDGIELGVILGNDLSRCVYVNGSFEPNEFNFLAGCLKPGMVVVDAGANEGLYSLFASRRVGNAGLVLAVEPSPRELLRLRDNIARNRVSNIRVHAVALSDRAGRARLRIAEHEHAGQNTLGQFAYEIRDAGMHEVEVAPLDELLQRENVRRVDLIKLDVEGSEYSLLRGAHGTLKQHRPILLFEIFERALRHQGATPGVIFKLLEDLGYRILVFDGKSGLPVDWDGQHPPSQNVIAVPG